MSATKARGGGGWSSSPASDRVPVAVLGATGAVGQTFIRLLDGHPLFRVAEVAASERSAGRPYVEAMSWHEGALPADVAALTVLPCDPSVVKSKVVFSALDASVAGEVEQAFAAAGAIVLSNAKNHRMDADVPLVIPEVNADHLSMIDGQRAKRAGPARSSRTRTARAPSSRSRWRRCTRPSACARRWSSRCRRCPERAIPACRRWTSWAA